MPDNRPLPPEVAERIGPWYVYVLVHPGTGHPFYVGKGTKQRLLSHGIEADKNAEPGQPEKLRRIRALRRSGQEPRIDVVRRGLTEASALQVEAALIDSLPDLANCVRGHGIEGGRETLQELVAQYGARPIGETPVPVLMIRLGPWRDQYDPRTGRRGRGYRPGMDSLEINNSTRAWWNVSAKEIHRRGVQHFVAVHRGVTRALYSIVRVVRRPDSDRIGFTGRRILKGSLFDAYVGPFGRRIPLAVAAQNPVCYWPSR